MAGIQINNDAWYVNMPELMLEGYWACKIGLNDEIFDRYITTMSIPQLNLEYEVTNFGLVKFQNKAEYGEGTFDYMDDVNGTFNSELNKWVNEVYNESTCSVKSSWRNAYRTIIVEYYRMINGKRNSIVQYRLLGCYPKGVSDVSADSTTGDLKTNTFTFIVSKVDSFYGENINTILDSNHYIIK